MKKILYITPHLSTGGLPQYLLKKIQLLYKEYNIYVIEYSFISPTYVIQRNKIKQILKNNFYSLSNNKNEILEIIKKINPDIIHFEEIPELFMDQNITQNIYQKNRNYIIFETSHTINFNPSNKIFIPDKFIFVSEFQAIQYKKYLNIQYDIAEYPIEFQSNLKNNKNFFKNNSKNIIIVGLFTPTKNQEYVFKLAQMLENYNIKFHFIGNTAPNFEFYWKKLIDNRPDNCIIHGEHDNITNFYNSADLLIFPSNNENGRSECNPIVIKEAIGHNLKILMFDQESYWGKYDYNSLINFLTGDINIDSIKILDLLNLRKIKIKIVHMITDINSQREIESINQLRQLGKYGIEYILHINEPYTKPAPSIKCWRPYYTNKKTEHGTLLSGHYGCYLAHRNAILSEFTIDTDLLIIAEADCKIKSSLKEFVDMIHLAGNNMNKHDISYFSFGDPHNIETGELFSPIINKIDNYMYITNKITCAHCVMFKNKDRDFIINLLQTEYWHVADFWYNLVFNKYNKKMAILNNGIATQRDGFSLIDNVYKTYIK